MAIETVTMQASLRDTHLLDAYRLSCRSANIPRLMLLPTATSSWHRLRLRLLPPVIWNMTTTSGLASGVPHQNGRQKILRPFRSCIAQDHMQRENAQQQ